MPAVDKQYTEQFKEIFRSNIKAAKGLGKEGAALAAMAYVLQEELTISERAVPHASALEIIMRAVAHDIAGDPAMRNYVREKMQIGYERFMAE